MMSFRGLKRTPQPLIHNTGGYIYKLRHNNTQRYAQEKDWMGNSIFFYAAPFPPEPEPPTFPDEEPVEPVLLT